MTTRRVGSGGGTAQAEASPAAMERPLGGRRRSFCVMSPTMASTMLLGTKARR